MQLAQLRATHLLHKTVAEVKPAPVGAVVAASFSLRTGRDPHPLPPGLDECPFARTKLLSALPRACCLHSLPPPLRTTHSCRPPAPAALTPPASAVAPACNGSGDLGAIDAKYDVAVSTATGGLDYVVVETASDAQVGQP